MGRGLNLELQLKISFTLSPPRNNQLNYEKLTDSVDDDYALFALHLDWEIPFTGNFNS